MPNFTVVSSNAISGTNHVTNSDTLTISIGPTLTSTQTLIVFPVIAGDVVSGPNSAALRSAAIKFSPDSGIAQLDYPFSVVTYRDSASWSISDQAEMRIWSFFVHGASGSPSSITLETYDVTSSGTNAIAEHPVFGSTKTTYSYFGAIAIVVDGLYHIPESSDVVFLNQSASTADTNGVPYALPQTGNSGGGFWIESWNPPSGPATSDYATNSSLYASSRGDLFGLGGIPNLSGTLAGLGWVNPTGNPSIVLDGVHRKVLAISVAAVSKVGVDGSSDPDFSPTPFSYSGIGTGEFHPVARLLGTSSYPFAVDVQMGLASPHPVGSSNSYSGTGPLLVAAPGILSDDYLSSTITDFIEPGGVYSSGATSKEKSGNVRFYVVDDAADPITRTVLVSDVLTGTLTLGSTGGFTYTGTGSEFRYYAKSLSTSSWDLIDYRQSGGSPDPGTVVGVNIVLEKVSLDTIRFAAV